MIIVAMVFMTVILDGDYDDYADDDDDDDDDDGEDDNDDNRVDGDRPS